MTEFKESSSISRNRFSKSEDKETENPWQNDRNLTFPNVSNTNNEGILDQLFSNHECAKIGAAYNEEVTVLRDSKFDGAEDRSRNFWKCASKNYGVNYNILSKESVKKDKTYESVEKVEHAEYYRKLYEDQETNADLIVSKTPSLVHRSKYTEDFSSYDWYLQTNSADIKRLTTLDIQSTICAALNSKYTLLWLIGVDDSCKIDGVRLNRAQRDTFRQGFDFALSNEFLPALDPMFTSLRFLPVTQGMYDDLYVVEIAVTDVVDTLYQLSSGRIYYAAEGRPKQLESFNEAYQILLSNSETSTCHHHERENSNTSFYVGLLAGVALGAIIYGVYKR